MAVDIGGILGGVGSIINSVGNTAANIITAKNATKGKTEINQYYAAGGSNDNKGDNSNMLLYGGFAIGAVILTIIALRL